MEILNAVKNNKFIYFGFDPRAENKDDQWNALPNLSVSSDGGSWDSVANFSNLKGLRDGFICRVGDVYYIIGTLALYKTSDFKLFTELDLSPLKMISIPIFGRLNFSRIKTVNITLSIVLRQMVNVVFMWLILTRSQIKYLMPINMSM